MPRVEVYETDTRTGRQRTIGELRLEDGKIVASTQKVADMILKRPIWVMFRGAMVTIDPIQEPRRFLENLNREFNGSYLRASELIQ